MKNTLWRGISAFVLLAVIHSASALTISGTITGIALTDLSANSPLDVGDRWTLGYAYASSTIDGTFTAAGGTLHLWTIEGLIDLPDDANRVRPTMTVANGLVSQFNAWNWTWCVTTTTWTWDGMVFGSVAISAPAVVTQTIAAASAPVPDRGSSFVLTALAMLLTIGMGRRLEALRALDCSADDLSKFA